MSNLPSEEENKKIWIEALLTGHKWFEWNVTERWNNKIAKYIEVIDPILVTSNNEIPI
jgi:hypothetical protein